MEQKIVEYEDLKIVYVEIEGDKYYPISYICRHILKKSSRVNIKSIKVGTIQELEINYDIVIGSGSIQKTYCINEIGLKDYLKKLKFGSLKKEESIKNYNVLCRYLNLEEKQRIVEEIDDYCIDKINKYKTEKHYKKCTKCGLELPINNEFFHKDKRNRDGYGCVCKKCTSGKFYNKKDDEYLNYIYLNYGNDMYVRLKELIEAKDYYQVFCIIEDYKIDKVPSVSEHIRLDIIYEYVKHKKISCEDLSVEKLCSIFKIKKWHSPNLEKIYNKCFPEWKDEYYKYIHITKSFEIKQLKKIFYNYLKDNNIIISKDNVYTLDYHALLKDCRIYNNVMKDFGLITFIMYFTNNKYASYKFNLIDKRYYKNEQNRNQALKYYIKNDLKIKVIEKIPLYLTKYKLQKTSLTLYNLLDKYYNKDLFLWVDKCYPNKFIKEDFYTSCVRGDFDSIDEIYINDLLSKEFKYNLIHNVSGDKYTIRLFGKQPDWFILTDNYCWIVEYWGMWSEKPTSSMYKMYKEKYEIKTEIYKNNLGYYKHLWIYPYDLDNDFKGLKEKIEQVKMIDREKINKDIVS